MKKGVLIAALWILLFGVACQWEPEAGNSEEALAQAAEYWDKDDFERAFAYYDLAVQLDPENAEAYYARGNAYRRAYNKTDQHCGTLSENYDKAISDFGRAIELDPDLAEAHMARGLVYQLR
jgi:tetratricopeptide (TPR) repeat protein